MTVEHKKEHKKEYKEEFKGKDYICYTCPKFTNKPSLFHEIVDCLKTNKHLSFSNSILETIDRKQNTKRNRRTILNASVLPNLIELFGSKGWIFPVVFFKRFENRVFEIHFADKTSYVVGQNREHAIKVLGISNCLIDECNEIDESLWHNYDCFYNNGINTIVSDFYQVINKHKSIDEYFILSTSSK